MKQKIEWYREVLEIEPNSKVFFPLARMLMQDGRPEEALGVLQSGVARHPDHVEARLLLVELLYEQGRTADLQREVDAISSLFKNYPGFWKAWGEKLFADDGTRDAGLAAVFLAAFMQNMAVSWAGVIEHGLKGLLGENGERFVSLAAREGYPLRSPACPQEMTVPQSTVESVAALVEPAASTLLPDADAAAPDEDELDEPISLRTRSMADVLAEQGDIAGSLDIYQELLAAAATEVEKKELRMRMDALARAAAPTPADQNGVDDAEGQPEGRNRLTDMLEALAQRLEARSLQ